MITKGKIKEKIPGLEPKASLWKDNSKRRRCRTSWDRGIRKGRGGLSADLERVKVLSQEERGTVLPDEKSSA